MPSFYAGDELGTIKHITYNKADKNEWKADVRSVLEGSSGKAGSIQKLALSFGDSPLVLFNQSHNIDRCLQYALKES